MLGSTTRRRFLGATAASGALAGLGDLSFLGRLRPVSAAESQLDPNIVQSQPEIEPLVRLLEDTPREELLEVVAARISEGLELSRIAGGAAAGRRAERPAAAQRGFQVPRGAGRELGASGQPGLAGRHRWLPIFWAFDEFKSSQAEDVARRQLDDGAGRRIGRAHGRPPRGRRLSTRWTAGTKAPPTPP